jgi:16S rRNA processing protein RimM
MKISVAYIKGPRGFKGELAAILYKPSSKSLKKGLTVTLEKEGRSQDFVVEFAKPMQKRMSLKLKGIDDRESAEHWKGSGVLVEKDQLEPLQESEYYHFDLEGMKVYDENDELIGTVKSVDSEMINPILNIESEDGEILIPFVKAIIREVDIEKKRIVIETIEGLIQ